MTRGEMRTMLRDRLQEVDVEIQWTNAKLNNYLNLGLQFMETEVLKVAPEEFIEEDAADLYADEDLIPKPIGMLMVKTVWLKYSGDTGYTKATKRRNDQIDDYVESGLDSGSDYFWASYGRWLRIFPTPSTNSTDGIILVFVPTLTMGSDTDITDLHLNLHEGIIYRAHQIALGNTDETVNPEVLDSLNSQLAVVVSRISLYLQVTDHGEPGEVELTMGQGFEKEDGWF